MKSPVVKRSIVITGHKTSVSLEDAFWSGLKDIAASRNMTLSELVASIDADRRQGNLSSAIRLFVLDHYRAQAGSAGGETRSARIRRRAAGDVNAARRIGYPAPSAAAAAAPLRLRASRGRAAARRCPICRSRPAPVRYSAAAARPARDPPAGRRCADAAARARTRRRFVA